MYFVAMVAQWVALAPRRNKGLGSIPIQDVWGLLCVEFACSSCAVWVSSGCSGYFPQSKDIHLGEPEMLNRTSKMCAHRIEACPGSFLPFAQWALGYASAWGHCWTKTTAMTFVQCLLVSEVCFLSSPLKLTEAQTGTCMPNTPVSYTLYSVHMFRHSA